VLGKAAERGVHDDYSQADEKGSLLVVDGVAQVSCRAFKAASD
jgi:hypothetical protein